MAAGPAPRLALGSRDGTASIVDPTTGERLLHLQGLDTRYILSVAWSPGQPEPQPESQPEPQRQPQPAAEEAEPPELVAWLAAFDAAPLGPDLDALGAESVQDLKELDAGDLKALEAKAYEKLKKLKAKKLVKALAALASVDLASGGASGRSLAELEAQPEPESTIESHGVSVQVMGSSDTFDFVFSNRTASDALCLSIRGQLTARGLHVWQQKTNIPKDSDNWFNEWFPSAVKSRKIVCFLTVAYLKSPYCMKEFGIALSSHKLLVVACEPLAHINAVDPSTYPHASNALAYLMGGGQVIFHDTEDVVAEILKFA